MYFILCYGIKQDNDNELELAPSGVCYNKGVICLFNVNYRYFVTSSYRNDKNHT